MQERLGAGGAVGVDGAPAIVRLPGGVHGLEEDVGGVRVVADDEVDVAGARLPQRVDVLAQPLREAWARSGADVQWLASDRQRPGGTMCILVSCQTRPAHSGLLCYPSVSEQLVDLLWFVSDRKVGPPKP